jgi:hypothetical protein
MALERERHIILTHQEAVRRIRQQVVRFVTDKWGGLQAWRDDDIAAFVDGILPAVMSGERSVARLTDAYLTAMARMAGDKPLPSALDLSQVTGSALRGVDPLEVYRRPGVSVWTALSEGKPLEQAVSEGLYRLQDLVAMDMQLAQTHTARARFSNRVVGHRRVLTGAENCALCIVASTQRYRKADLMPIHSGCDCGIAPIYGEADPGQVINSDRLEALHSFISENGIQVDRSAEDYRHVVIHQHGEHGATLGWRDHKFTGPNDI